MDVGSVFTTSDDGPGIPDRRMRSTSAKLPVVKQA
jgi:hypothetical protein